MQCERPQLRKRTTTLAWILLLIGSTGAALGQQDVSAKQVPVVDGAEGPCSVEFTVMDDRGKPVYGATIDVHFAYGFMGVRKLDLQVGTNADGKARFSGIPAKVKDGTMFFRASKENLSGTTFYDPSKTCTARKGINLFEKH